MTGHIGRVIHNPMGWWPRFIEAAARFLAGRPRVILTRGAVKGPYLSRYYLVRRHRMPDGSWPFDENGDPREGIVESDLPVGLYLHCFHRSDNAGDLHSHPHKWAVSLILSGGYVEERWEPIPDLFKGLIPQQIRKRVVKPGHLNVLTGQTFHRVDLMRNDAYGRQETPCWTLFLVGPKFAGWGFRDRLSGRFIPWKKYGRGGRVNGVTETRPATHAELNDLDEDIYNGRGDR